MPKIIAAARALLILLPAFAGFWGAGWPGGRATAADMQEQPRARLRLSEYSTRSCVEDCIAQCRAAKTQCSAAKERSDECKAQFQICARRCVVSCNPR